MAYGLTVCHIVSYHVISCNRSALVKNNVKLLYRSYLTGNIIGPKMYIGLQLFVYLLR